MKHLLLTTIAAVVLVGCGNLDRALIDAARDGSIALVRRELSRGADVNAKDKDGFTPLHLAANKGHKEIVKLLIAEGADVNAKDDGGRTPLHGTAYWGRKEIVELLIAKGADVNVKIEVGELKGLTPLDAATHPDNPNASAETANLLRKHGAKTAKELKAEGK
jgi:ankyrin repeat protein